MLSVCHLLTVSVWRVPSVAPHALLLHYYVILCYLYSGLLRRALFNRWFCTVFPPLLVSPPRTGFPAPQASTLHVAFPPPPRALNSHLEVESRRAIFYASTPPSTCPPLIPLPLDLMWPDLTWPDQLHGLNQDPRPHLVTLLHRFCNARLMTRLDPTQTQVISPWPFDLSDLLTDFEMASQAKPSRAKPPPTHLLLPNSQAVKSCLSSFTPCCQTHKTVSLPLNY